MHSEGITHKNDYGTCLWSNVSGLLCAEKKKETESYFKSPIPIRHRPSHRGVAVPWVRGKEKDETVDTVHHRKEYECPTVDMGVRRITQGPSRLPPSTYRFRYSSTSDRDKRRNLFFLLSKERSSRSSVDEYRVPTYPGHLGEDRYSFRPLQW